MAMAALATAYGGAPPTPERIRLYWAMLQREMTDDQLRTATLEIIRSSRYFPSVAELLEVTMWARLADRDKSTRQDRAMIVAPRPEVPWERW